MVSKREVLEYRWEEIHRLVEFVGKGEVCEKGWEGVDTLVEVSFTIVRKSEVRERGRQVIHWVIELTPKSEV